MKIQIDVDGNVGFNDWFDEEDAEKIADVLNALSLGFNIEIEKVDYEFSAYPILKKRSRGEKIPKTARNIFLILSNLDKKNDEVLKILGIEREKGSFVISTMGRNLQGEYIKWQKIDHKKKWKDDEERMRAFAGYFESKAKMSNNKIIKIIKKMEKDGCLQLLDEKFPECKKEFNTECISCQFGSKYIKTQADAERFSEVLNNEFE